MRLPELRKLLRELSELGFVQSERKGPTGIGHTLEEWLGVSENNLPIPDIGGRVEIKATRSTTNNLITLFTFNKAAWKHPQAEIIERWGYTDPKGRPALYSTVSAAAPNAQGLQVVVPPEADSVSVIHAPSGDELASWDLFHMVGKFMAKFERLLLVHANTRQGDAAEEFHFNGASFLSDPSAQTFRKGFDAGNVFIDIRMHLRPGRSVRNHGTAFRVHEHDLPSLFGNTINLLQEDPS